MKRNLILLTGTLIGFSTNLWSQQEKPNIVFFITDDQSQKDASIYGAPDLLKTPNMETIARHGMVFDNAFVASPSCAPSRAALLTGLMPARNGAEANHTYPTDKSMYLIKNFKKAGYQAYAFGKVAHGKANREVGFDYYENVGLREDLAGTVINYFQKNQAFTKPQFVMVGDRRPHVPWIKESIYNPDDVTLPHYLIDTRETREHWAQYLTDITGLDEEMGKIYNWARETFGDNLIFIYTSDHGGQWPFGKWNLYDAGIKVPFVMVWPNHIKPQTRTDAMISWIDIFPTLFEICGIEIPENLDGKSFRGVLTGEKKTHRDEIYTTHSGDGNMNVYPIRSIRNEKYKFILNLLPCCYHTNHSDILRKPNAGAYWDSWDRATESDKKAASIVHKYFVRPAEEFYDIQNDPTEQINLINSKKHKKIINEMRKNLIEWMDKQGDRRKVFNPPYPVCGPKP
jgi:arylsulfatase A-like enzyme